MRLNTIFVTSILGVYYFLAPLVVMFFVKDDKKYKIIRIVLLSSFFILLLIGILSEIDFNKNNLYIGFNFSSGWMNKSIIWRFPKFKIDLVINSLMLIPVGQWVFMCDTQKKQKFGVFRAAIFGVLIGATLEILQFVLPVNRSVQLSDVILNTLSAVIGYMYMMVFYWGNVVFKKFVLKR